MKDHLAMASVTIAAPAERVWTALTRPELVKRWLFGTEVETDWRPGSPIRFRGSWQGKSYEDKGVVQECTASTRLVYTFWSSLSGVPDAPEHYKTITCTLSALGDKTLLALTQDHNATEEAKQHSEGNWRMVLEGLKKVAEAG